MPITNTYKLPPIRDGIYRNVEIKESEIKKGSGIYDPSHGSGINDIPHIFAPKRGFGASSKKLAFNKYLLTGNFPYKSAHSNKEIINGKGLWSWVKSKARSAWNWAKRKIPEVGKRFISNVIVPAAQKTGLEIIRNPTNIKNILKSNVGELAQKSKEFGKEEIKKAVSGSGIKNKKNKKNKKKKKTKKKKRPNLDKLL